MSVIRAVLFLVSSTRASLLVPCPSGFLPASNKCFKAFTSPATFCGAQTACAQIKGRLVEGSEWFAILKDRNSAPWSTGLSYIWTGLNDLLEERHRNRNGWQWSSGGRASVAVDAVWYRSQPDNMASGQDCALFIRHTGFVLHDGDCILPYSFICEPMSGPDRLTNFIPVKTEALVPNGFAQGECKVQLEGLERFDCFAACLPRSINTTGCVSLYHNAAVKSCILLYHSDASVKLEDPSSWIKYRGVK